jgi:predicted metal-dependent peptidase
MSSAALRIDRARWWALSNQPFYGSLAMSLPDVMDSSIDTAATDGRTIRWNPKFVDGLTDSELRFVLLHETLHCAHQHMWRLPADERGNAAADHEINLTLNTLAGVDMPTDGLADPQYAGMACEDILRAMPEPEPDPDGDQGSGDSGDSGDQAAAGDSPGNGKPDPCGSFTAPAADDGSGSPADPQQAAQAQQQLREDWETRVIQAAQAQQALGVGDLPGDMARMLDKIRHQAVDWRREMADFVKDAASTRNDWSRAARRHAWQSVIYPRKRADDVGTVIFARDTSGSVDDRTVAEYSALITDCMAETGCSGLVLDVDTSIRAEYVLDGFTECPLTAKGGGGTDFRPVFNRADEMVAAGEHIAGIVYLTDLYGPAPDSSEIPTLWLATSDKHGKFGRTVRIES